MYTFESRVRYSEITENGCLSLSALIDYMQDCTNFESEDLGVGLEWYAEHGLMWVLNAWQIVIARYPKMGERILIGTQSYGCRKMLGYRNFLVTDQTGEYIAKANSIWVMMDIKKGRPTPVPPEAAEIYGKAEPLEMDYAPRKIKLPTGGTAQDKLMVHAWHLDTNHHVNNQQYVQIAMEYLEKDKTVKELRVEYKKQAVLGDSIIPVIYPVSEKESIVSLNAEDGRPYAVIQFFL